MPSRLPRIVACLLLGLISTVAIAWFLATEPFHTHATARQALRPVAPSAEGVSVDRYSPPGTTLIVVEAGTSIDAPADHPFEAEGQAHISVDSLVPGEFRSILVPWSWVGLAPSHPAYSARRMLIRGWPFPALWCALEGVPAPGYWGHRALSGWIINDDWKGFCPAYPPGDPPVIIPYRPYWPGLIPDTFLYGALWWGAINGFASLRRARGRRRGHCPACNYNLAGLATDSPCPECGRARG